jgi:WD40 repeat protein
MLDQWPAHSKTGYDAVDWSQDGLFIAAAGWDGKIAIWEVDSGEMIRLLDGHTLGVNRVAWSPDNRLLASGGWDGSIIIWDRSFIESPK